jgi:hypothetical protein
MRSRLALLVAAVVVFASGSQGTARQRLPAGAIWPPVCSRPRSIRVPSATP